jgi:hypothetical protein
MQIAKNNGIAGSASNDSIIQNVRLFVKPFFYTNSGIESHEEKNDCMDGRAKREEQSAERRVKEIGIRQREEKADCGPLIMVNK